MTAKLHLLRRTTVHTPLANTMHITHQSHMSLRWLMNALAKLGISKEYISNKIGITPQAFEDQLDRLPVHLYFSIMNWAADVNGSESFGIDLVDEIDLANMGLYGYLLQNAPTLKDFCETFSQHLATLTFGASLQLEQLKNCCRISYAVLYPTTEDTRHDVEMTLAIPVVFFRKQIGLHWVPLTAHFTHSEPANINPLSELFGPSIYFDQPSNHIEFDTNILHLNIAHSDAILFSLLKKQADEFLLKAGAPDNLTAQVRALLFHSLGDEHVDSNTIAKQLNMSRSSLFRQLKTTGTSLQKLKNKIIEETAKKALIESNTRISVIALMLGYAELSAFTRAFKQMTGESPSEYRQKNIQSKQ